MRFFISYRRKAENDRHLADFLRQGLEQAGHEVFIDVGMPVGTDWVAEIERRIDWCHYLVVLLSEKSIHSEMVQGEVRMAHHRRRRDGTPGILPIRVGYDGPLGYELDSYLHRVQYASWERPDDSQRLLDALVATPEPTDVPASEPDAEPRQSDEGLSEPDSRRPVPVVDPRVLKAPGGTLKPSDPFYVERPSDRIVAATASQVGETLVIKAPRQMGKSSLLIRYLAACRETGKRFAFVDFQSFTDRALGDYFTLLNRLAAGLLRGLDLGADPAPEIATQSDFINFVEDRILKAIDAPVTLAFDEVDRVLGRPYQRDFFAMLRLWHNKRAEPLSPWENLDLALVIATEPYLLIDTADQSPFNVTPAVELTMFARPCLDDLNGRYGTALGSAELDRLFELVSGHPYLTRLAFYRVVANPDIGFADLMHDAADSEGPFGDHLRAKLMQLQQQGELMDAMGQVVTLGKAPSHLAYSKLHGAGLVISDSGRDVPANLLYARFFKDVR